MKAYARLLYRRVIQRFSKTHEDLGRYFKLLIPILLTCFVALKGLIFYWTPEADVIAFRFRPLSKKVKFNTLKMTKGAASKKSFNKFYVVMI